MNAYFQQMMAAAILPAAMTAEMMARTGAIVSRHMTEALRARVADDMPVVAPAQIAAPEPAHVPPMVGSLATPAGPLPA